jgi:hypothetical protein
MAFGTKYGLRLHESSSYSSFLAVRKCHRAHKRLQVLQVKRWPFVQYFVRVHEQMSQYVVLCYDKKLRAIFKVTFPMRYRLRMLYDA